MSVKLSFTVTLSEEDRPLLSFLQNLPQEQWEDLIKEALRVYIAPPSSMPTQRSIEDLLVVSPDSLPNLSSSPPANNPLNHLWALIGEEEDDEVLEFLLHKNNNKPELSTIPEEAPMEDQEQVPVKKPDVPPSKGLTFVLNQVIGEEDDPEVLRFFTNR